MMEHMLEERSLAETPTWAVATVICVMVPLGFLVNSCLEHFGKWLGKTHRKSLLAALEKIKEELMLFGVLSLLMGHWIIIVAKICVKSTVQDNRFYPCAMKHGSHSVRHSFVSSSDYLNKSVFEEHHKHGFHDYCPKGKESFASHDSLEQLHRFVFVLGVTHVFYSFASIAFAMIKIYSWRIWENEAKTNAQSIPVPWDIFANKFSPAPQAMPNSMKMRRLSTFISHRTSHSWSQHRVLVWLLCFCRQFWSSINRSDYRALRLGFLTKHQLPLTYDFHSYLLRSMEDEFRHIVGISVPLWIYAIFCIFLDFHGSNIYFWLSFLPAILILLIGTKLHRVVVKLAVEITDNSPAFENHQFNLRDDLFWFGKPKFLLQLIHFISFQNAFEMANFIWSLWEIREPSCFMDNRIFLVVRLIFGVTSQFWCSYITFPLYVIITQMGSRFKKSVMTENVRKSLSGWQRRVKARKSTPSSAALLTATSSVSTVYDMNKISESGSNSSMELGKSFRLQDTCLSNREASIGQDQSCGILNGDGNLQLSGFAFDSRSSDGKDNDNGATNELLLLPP
ncbi:hypothetical protein FEM48_Zijuj08G0087900 [Ziziphus jujuba var. spinosa]|uniref:MLO-like protein n=1 Tax=Ziziphus jujuba var. spinosa TaxID=714518 RepID=A0A978UY47_ZIZJJ|nr:hypothetical protein FEM48_Zijuj08G0087900 [Ziziphus jujuba var. spinosa]